MRIALYRMNMFDWLFGKSLDKALCETKKVRVKGIKFNIKKIDVLNFLDGSNVMAQTYSLYKSGKSNEIDQLSQKKIREYLCQALVAGVVEPKLALVKEGRGQFVEDLFSIPGLIEGLYYEIMEFTYGKKKFSHLT